VGDPKKKRKKYKTPRKKWDKQLLEAERKMVDFYGLKNKKELRKHGTWLKNKRQIARSLLALTLETRLQREKELISGLRKIGLVNENATLDDVLGLKVEELLEKRLQTIVLRKGLANTSKQARQFIIHGHISLNNNKINVPSYLVPIDKVSDVSWYKNPIIIELEPKKDLKKEFEKAAGIETKEDGDKKADKNTEEIKETIDGNPKEEKAMVENQENNKVKAEGTQ